MIEDSIKRIQNLDEKWLYYIAGIIDSDGCISVRNTVGSSLIQICNSSREFLEKISKLVFGKVAHIGSYPTGHNKKMYHHLWITGRVAAALLKRIEPFLVIKRDKAKRFLELPVTQIRYRGKTMKICMRCGKKFSIYYYRKNTAKYCSKKCFYDRFIPSSFR